MGLYYVHPVFDPIAAIIVSLIIIWISVDLTKRAFDALLDKTPKGLRDNIVTEIKTINGVESIKSLRIRTAGAKTFIDMIVNIGRTKMFDEIHNITKEIENKIQLLAPKADVLVHSEPVETESETINDKVKLIVNSEGFKCHDVFSHLINNEIYTELHVEIEQTNDLNEAHNVISCLERRIQSDIGLITHIKIHIDEPSGIVYNSIDVTTENNEILNFVKDLLKGDSDIKYYHDIKVIKTDEKLRISLNCEFDSNYQLDKVHEIVTILESKLYLKIKEKFNNLTNVIIHAEPFGHN